MDTHLEALQKTCRICGELVFSSKSTSQVSKYKTKLLAVYQLAVDDDKPGIHPTIFCGKCRNVVMRAHCRIMEGKEFNGTLIQPTVFIGHDGSCTLCTNYLLHTASLLPPLTRTEPSTSSSTSGILNLESTTRILFPESVPDPGCAAQGRKRIWSVKASLGEVRRDYARKRVGEASSSIDLFCKEHKENKTDLLYYLLTENLRELSDDRYKEVLASWRRESKSLTPNDCLAMRVTTMMTKGQYRRQYDFLSKKGDIIMAPPSVLTMLERNYMPGNARFQLDGQGEVVYHTPVKQGRDKAVGHEYGQVTFEPMDLTDEFHPSTELPTPNFRAMAWPYVHALAKTLEELDPIIEQNLVANGYPPHDQDVLVLTTVKDGADGMGDISIYKEASDRLIPDKAFRAAFTVLRCEVEKDGERLVVYEPSNPNSVTVTRPLLEAIADENNKSSSAELLAGIERDRQLLQERELRVFTDESTRRRHRCTLFQSMIDEKFDRSAGGLQGSGSRYMCTLCHATNISAKSELGTFSISRTREEAAELAKYIQVNPDNLTTNELTSLAKGVKSQPVIHSEPRQRLIDATHADINMGSFFNKIITCEIARLQTWNITKEVKTIYQDSQKKLNNHLRSTLGSVPSLMLPGNQARLLFGEKKRRTDSGSHRERRKEKAVVRGFGSLSSTSRSLQGNAPRQGRGSNIQSFKATAIEMCNLLLTQFSYVSWPNYLHKLTEHVQEIVEDPLGPGSVGALSSEGNEAANKLFRHPRSHFSRQNSTSQSPRDVLWFHWLYTSPKLRAIGEVRSRKYTCSKCGQLGHGSLHCPAP